MSHIDWFVEKMKSEFNMEVPHDEVSYEAYEFYHDEIDELLVPAEHLEKLPNPLLLEALMYVDAEGYERKIQTKPKNQSGLTVDLSG